MSIRIGSNVGSNYPASQDVSGSQNTSSAQGASQAEISALVEWVKDAQAYLNSGTGSAQERAQVQAWLSQSLDTLQNLGVEIDAASSSWDPISQNGTNVTSANTGTATSEGLNAGVQAAYVDDKKMVFDELVPYFTFDPSDARSEFEFYGYGEMTLDLGPKACHVESINVLPDGSRQIVIKEDRGEGRKTYTVSPGIKLTILAGNPELQVSTSVSQNVKDVTVMSPEEYGKDLEAEAEVSQNPPTEVTKDGTQIWDQPTVDVSTNDLGAKNEIFANTGVTITAGSNREQFEMTWNAAKGGYELTSTTTGKTTFIHDMADAINLNIDVSCIKFKGEIGKPDGSLNTDNVHAKKIAIAGAEEAQAAAEEAAVAESLPNSLVQFAKQIGVSSEDLITAIRNNFADAPVDPAAFSSWLQTNFNPPKMSTQLVDFVMQANPKIQSLWAECAGTDMTANPNSPVRGKLEQIQNALISGLKSLGIDARPGQQNAGTTFDGTNYGYARLIAVGDDLYTFYAISPKPHVLQDLSAQLSPRKDSEGVTKSGGGSSGGSVVEQTVGIIQSLF